MPSIEMDLNVFGWLTRRIEDEHDLSIGANVILKQTLQLTLTH